MPKKSSESSRPARRKSMRSEDIFGKPLNSRQRAVIKRVGERQRVGDDSQINFEDSPRLTSKQLAEMVRLREVRPPKIAVSVRLDERVLTWLKDKGEGHLTRINDILTNVMEAERRHPRR
jgi:uncharacterized protein (DUF4415 family)